MSELAGAIGRICDRDAPPSPDSQLGAAPDPADLLTQEFLEVLKGSVLPARLVADEGAKHW